MEFIRIPSTLVEFENGHKELVSEFSISRSCVTVGEYQMFQDTTGYVTVAEEIDEKVYNDNELIEELLPYERINTPASCMSPRDALAYCVWAGCRLPTEAEWLAASICDWTIYDVDNGEWPVFCDSSGNLNVDNLPWNISVQSGEITLDCSTNKTLFIERNGPLYFRDTYWQKDVNSHHVVVAIEDSDLMRCFRCCKH